MCAVHIDLPHTLKSRMRRRLAAVDMMSYSRWWMYGVRGSLKMKSCLNAVFEYRKDGDGDCSAEGRSLIGFHEGLWLHQTPNAGSLGGRVLGRQCGSMGYYVAVGKDIQRLGEYNGTSSMMVEWIDSEWKSRSAKTNVPSCLPSIITCRSGVFPAMEGAKPINTTYVTGIGLNRGCDDSRYIQHIHKIRGNS